MLLSVIDLVEYGVIVAFPISVAIPIIVNFPFLGQPEIRLLI